MKYLVIGVGGTGGGIGGYLARAGKDVTLIARGRHLEAMKEHGLCVEVLDESFSVPVRACTMEEYQETPDVIFVCVKGYSMEDVVPFIQRAADAHTIVIPILNIYGTGRKLQEKLPDMPVLDGCIYIAAEIKEPGTIRMFGKIFRVVYGLRKGTPDSVRDAVMPVLKKIEGDLSDSRITPLLSDEIEKDALQKFSFVSPMASVGAGFDAQAKDMQAGGKMREKFADLVEEIRVLSEAMGIHLPEDIVEINLKIMDDLVPTATASMQRDIRDGKRSEVDGLVYEVVRLGRQYQVPVPGYEEIAEKLQKMLQG